MTRLRTIGVLRLTCGVSAAAMQPVFADDDIATVQTRVQQLQQQSQDASDRAQLKRAELAAAEAKLDQTQAKLESVRKTRDSQRRTVEQVARQLYVNGGVDHTAAGFVFDDPDHFLDNLDRAAAATTAQNAALQRVQSTVVSQEQIERVAQQQRDPRSAGQRGVGSERAASREALGSGQRRTVPTPGRGAPAGGGGHRGGAGSRAQGGRGTGCPAAG